MLVAENIEYIGIVH